MKVPEIGASIQKKGAKGIIPSRGDNERWNRCKQV